MQKGLVQRVLKHHLVLQYISESDVEVHATMYISVCLCVERACVNVCVCAHVMCMCVYLCV